MIISECYLTLVLSDCFLKSMPHFLCKEELHVVCFIVFRMDDECHQLLEFVTLSVDDRTVTMK